MNRRTLLGLVAAGGLGSLAGCADTVHRLRGANTPLTVVVENDSGEARTVAIRIDRDGETQVEGAVTFDADGAVTSTDGDDVRDAEFESAGRYAAVAESGDRTAETAATISWRDLADCNDQFVAVRVAAEEVSVGVQRTQADCGGIDRLGG